MNKSKLAIMVDTTTITLIVFIILFFWIRKYIKSAFLLVFICILLSLCIFSVIFIYFIKHYNLKNISIKDQKHSNICLQNLKLSSKETSNFFYQSLLRCSQIKNNIFENNKYIFYINLRMPLSQNDFFNALDHHYTNSKEIIFIAETCTEEFYKLLKDKSIICHYFSYTELYKLMKERQMFPADTLIEKSFSSKIKEKLKIFLSTITKLHFKDYFFSGISLLLISFFIPYSIYYSIFGTILIFLSILCLLKNKDNPSPSYKNNTSLTDIIKNSTD